MRELKKIVILGPESTGKSTLCKQLANHYDTLWCPEYARDYLHKHGKAYKYDHLLTIAKGQVALEEEYIKKFNSKPGVLFIDTDMYVMKVWCEYVFGKCHKWILDQIVKRRYDLYLLCNTDLPWVKDELREYPGIQTRNKLYSIYKDILINQAVSWKEISGDYDERLKSAIDAVNTVLDS